jgi:putative transcriptional regulator
MGKLSEEALLARDAERNIGAELLESVRQMKRGDTHIAHVPARTARERTGLSQAEFAALLGVSVRTLQGWEQGRTRPSGAARTLLAVALRTPEALLAAAA